MNLRAVLCVVAASLGSWSCNRSAAPDAPSDASTSTPGPKVSFNGFEIDVRGAEPAVPPELEADQPNERARRLPAAMLPGVEQLAAMEADEAVGRRRSELRADGAAAKAPRKWIVQFHGPIHEVDRARLADAGARIGDYLPDFAFVVSMDDEARKRVEALPSVRGVVRYKPAYKIARRLKDESGAVRVADGKAVKIRVRSDSVEGVVSLLSEVHKAKGKVQRTARDVAQVEVSRAAIARLAQLEDVLWIEEAVPLQLLNDTSRWTIQTNVPGDTRLSEQGLDGAGQIVGIGDTGLDYDACFFRDPSGAAVGPGHRKVAGYAVLADDYDGDSGHGTHVAGTVGGDQEPITGGATANGMAPKAKVFMTDLFLGESNSFYPPADLGTVFAEPYAFGARIHTNSWGASINAYDSLAWSVDRFMWEHKDFLVLFANGNAGPGEASVGFPATAKDVVSVGATENGERAEHVASFSSNGPASDGRIKPTLTAPGVAIASADSDGIRGSNNCGTVSYSGTSMATPTVAGAAALVRQYYVDGYWPSGMARPADGFAPSAALVKATLLSSAQGAAGDYTDGPIPSSGQGWGRINLSNTLRFAGDARFLDVFDSAEGLTTAATWTKATYSPGGTPLKATLVWTDYPATGEAAKALVNDLDLEVTAPDGATYLGNVFADGASVAGGSADRLNVEEQVFIPASARGHYTVRVKGYNVPLGPQPFAVVLTSGSGVTSRGYIGLDRSRYGAATTIEVKVGDADLNLDPAAADEVWVTVRSEVDPAGEMVRLVEAGPDLGVFFGTVPTGPAPGTAGDGIVAVAEGATIYATYQDADDGTGPATVTETAIGDLTPPVIASVAVAAVGQGGATISWSTNEPAAPAVLYGETPALGATVSSPWLGTAHALKLVGLKEATRYFFAVEATDEAGNVARHDGAGAPLELTTLTLPPELDVHSSSGLETFYGETTIFGTVRDPSGIASLTVNGTPLTPRPVDGYYELAAPLALGANTFVVVATDGLGLVQTASLTVTRLPLPDLVVRSVTSPERAGAGMPFTSTVVVCNEGASDATPENWRLAWVILDDEGRGYVIHNLKLWSWVGAGQCLTQTRSISIGPAYAGRTWHLGAFADLYDDVWEDDEDNNYGEAPNPVFVELPDLAVSAVAAPAEVGTATPFDVTTTVANLGGGNAYETTVHLYLSTDDAITPADRRIHVQSKYQLVPGQSSVDLTSSVTLPSDLAGGTYRLGAIVDLDGHVAEADEANNVLLGPSITVAAPDLEVASVSGPPAALGGSSVTIHDVVSARPTGGGASRFTVALYLSPDPLVTAADVKIGERVVAGLASGESSPADTMVTIPTTIAGGPYFVGAIVDAWNEVLETVETNNAAAGSAIEILGPDLVAAAASAPASAFTGATIAVGDTVVASASGGATPEFDVGIYLSADATVTPSDLLLGWRHVPALPPGQASTGTTDVTVPGHLPPGRYWIGIVADDFTHCWEDQWESVWCVGGDVVKEADGTNNARTAGAVDVTGADLGVTELSAPATCGVGQPLVVRNTVATTGGGTGAFAVSFYLSSDATITSSDRYLGKRDLGALPPGGTSTADTSLTVPATIAPGRYFIGAIADSANAVIESNEANNARAGSTVDVLGADLTVTSVSVPQNVTTGTTIDVTVHVANVGYGASPTALVELFLSSDPMITAADNRLAYRWIGPLAPGAFAPITMPIQIGNLAPGSWYLGAIVDRLNQVKEGDETNNVGAAPPMAVAGTDLVPTSAAGPASALTGATIVVSQTVAAAPSGGAVSFGVGVYLSTDAVITPSDLFIGARDVSGLAAGASSAGSASATIPTTIAGGTYHLGVIVDHGSRVPELDESNNALLAGTIEVTGPDLVAAAVSGPASATRGSTVTVSDTVTASPAGGAAPEFYVGVFLSTDSVITPGDRLIGTRWVPGLAPGGATSASTSVTIPSDLVPGTYHLGVIADDFVVYVGDEWAWDEVYDNAKESDETNNALAGGTIAVQ